MKFMSRTIAGNVLISILLSIALSGCQSRTSPPGARADDVGIRALVMARANSLSAAVSALQSIDSGQLDVARSTLEGEIKSGLTVIHALAPDFVANEKEKDLVEEAIREAEAYAKSKGIEVPHDVPD